MPPPSPKEVPTPKENIPPRPRVVGSPVASPSSEALRDGSNAASPQSRFEALGKGSNNATPQSRSVTLSPKSQRKNVKNAMAPAHVEDKPMHRVVSKEETKEEKPAPPAPKADKKHEQPSFLRDLILYAALGASLGAAFALAVPVSLFASTPAFYQKLSLAAHALVPAEMAAGHGMTVFDLGQPSLAAEFDCVARLVAGLPVEPLAVTGLGTGGPGFVIVDPSDFRDFLRMMFSGSLLMLTVVIFAGLSALRMFIHRHYGAPLQALVEEIAESAAILQWHRAAR